MFTIFQEGRMTPKVIQRSPALPPSWFQKVRPPLWFQQAELPPPRARGRGDGREADII